MNSKPVAVVIAIAVFAVSNVDAQAQTASIGEHLADNIMLRSGAEEPASVSRARAVTRLAGSIGELEVEPADRLILERWARDVADFQQQEKIRADSYYASFCERLQTAELDVTSGLLEASRVAAESEEIVLSTFEEASAHLSNAGRLTVNEYVDQVLIAGMVHLRIDFDRLLQQAGPEAVTAHLVAQCAFNAAHSEQGVLEVLNARERSPASADSSEAGGASADHEAQQQSSGQSGSLSSTGED